MIILQILGALLVISLLVIIHEGGHYLVARAFGMRVVTFSIGFGPVIARWRPRGSETVFQIAAVPVLAYVQIAGMSPTDEVDPNDRGSYLNATPIARFLTIAAGPVANYLAAGLAMFILFSVGGDPIPLAQVGKVNENTPAAVAGLQANDLITRINHVPVTTWKELTEAVQLSNGGALVLDIHRGTQDITLSVTPKFDTTDNRFRLGITQSEFAHSYAPVPIADAARDAVIQPAVVTMLICEQLGKMFSGKNSVQVSGIVGIVSETVEQAKTGWRNEVSWVAQISLQLFIFNLLPIPALDGGRLIVLAYEMIARRRPNPKIEARVLAASLMLMIGLFLVVTSREVWGLFAKLFHGGN